MSGYRWSSHAYIHTYTHIDSLLFKSCNGAPIGIEEALDFLLLHLPEESLPARFDPRGRNFDVVLPDNANASG